LDTTLDSDMIGTVADHRTPNAPEDVSSDFGVAFQFLRSLWELNHSLESASRAMKKQFGVTGPERLFVRIVGKRPGITPREIAQILRVHPSTVTVVIKRVEARRLIARGVNPADARSFQLYLTPEGERINAMRAGTIEAVVRDAIGANDPADVATAAGILVDVAQRLASRMARTETPVRRSRRIARR
jgi:MarR family transcriptional regulator, organic hydroperoxide resistance regulator